METAPAIVDRLYELIEAGDPERIAMLYAPDGEIVRYDGVAASPSEIVQYFRSYLAGRPGIALREIVKVVHSGDVLMWDALLDSNAGVMQTIDVVILDSDGRIRRHVPGFRGYWGR